MYTQHFSRRKKVLLGLVLTLFVALPAVPHVSARILEGVAFLLTQYRADFDRNGHIDFVDFTIFSSFYEG